MSVMELLRGVTSSTGEGRGPDHQPPLHRHLLAGAGAALASALVIVLPALIAWVASPQSTVPWTDALGVGASLWLLSGGSWLRAGSASIAFVPLLMFAALVAGAAWGAWRSGLEAAECSRAGDPQRGGLLRRPVADALAAWAGGYAVCAALWALVASASSPRPQVLGLAVPLLVVPVMAAALAASRLVVRVPGIAGPHWRRPDAVPDFVRRALRPAASVRGAMLAIGTALVVLLVALRLPPGRPPAPAAGPGCRRRCRADPRAGAVPAQRRAVGCLLRRRHRLLGGRGRLHDVDGLALGAAAAGPGAGRPARPGCLPGMLPPCPAPRRGGRADRLALAPRRGAAVDHPHQAAGDRHRGRPGRRSGRSPRRPCRRLTRGLAPLRHRRTGRPMALALLAEFAVGAGLVLGWDRWRLRR